MMHTNTYLARSDQHQHRRRGILLADLMTGIFIMALLTTVLLVSLNLRSKSMRKLESQRAALQQAERTLATLQTGAVAPAFPGSALSVRRTGKQIGAMEWVEISVSRDGRSASLAGLAPTTQRAQP